MGSSRSPLTLWDLVSWFLTIQFCSKCRNFRVGESSCRDNDEEACPPRVNGAEHSTSTLSSYGLEKDKKLHQTVSEAGTDIDVAREDSEKLLSREESARGERFACSSRALALCNGPLSTAPSVNICDNFLIIVIVMDLQVLLELGKQIIVRGGKISAVFKVQEDLVHHHVRSTCRNFRVGESSCRDYDEEACPPRVNRGEHSTSTLSSYGLEKDKKLHQTVSEAGTDIDVAREDSEKLLARVGESAYHDDDDAQDEEGPLGIEGGEYFTNTGASNDLQNEEKNLLTVADQDTSKTHEAKKAKFTEGIGVENEDLMAFNKGFIKNTGLSLDLSMIRAVFVKKAIHTWRNRLITLVQLILPVLFTILILAPSDEEKAYQEAVEPPLTLDLTPFGKTFIPVTAGLKTTSTGAQMADVYEAQFGTSQTVEKFSETHYDFINYTVKRMAEIGTVNYKKKMIIGLEMIEPSGRETLAATAFFNGQPFHSKAVSVNYMMNALLRTLLNDTFSLQTTLAPLPKEVREHTELLVVTNQLAGFLIAFGINFCMAFLTSSFVYFFIKERQVGAKHLQVVSGVGPVTYWLPTFLWDFINYIVPSLLILLVFVAFSEAAYVADGRFALVILVFIMYGWAVLPFMYLTQFIFKSPPAGVVVVIILNIISGLVTLMAVTVLNMPYMETKDTGEALDGIFSALFPNYNMASCFSNIYTNYLEIEKCADVDCSSPRPSLCCKETCQSIELCAKYNKNYMAWEKPGIGSYLCYMGLQGIVFFLLVMLVEYNVLQKIW
ncbi:ATP-binding cassette sub-family A member [Elysia marginata]|uniref:ATP-binding cassette sub-family A member n=1 Tax=Elysia marginata TaxID=1093978 RepID=A0AAV4IRF1_9GAST|nr:ATP-binding cassette sub-family A member [Elysia marginata]